ncbi:MAG TPA: M15 family metallopeptidase [Gemmatimonadaceae bacterium]|nr:M15 family metallopeptidase [Gemmatimonadaceae bacterium]
MSERYSYAVRTPLNFLCLAIAISCVPHSRSVKSVAVAPPVNTAETEIAPDAVADTLLANVQSLDPTIVVDLRYATPNNFTGAPLPGYQANRAYLRREAAAALARVQRDLRPQGLALKIFDAYRPVRATLAMVEWTERVHRSDLLRDGYIASRSRHNLGLAIDLTLIDLATGRELEMGTPFDTFSAAAHTANATGVAAVSRQKLKAAMEAEGFVNYDQEWWHYIFNVPNPLRFDRPIR